MNSYTFMGLDDVEEREEISSRKKIFIKRAITYIKMRRKATRVTRNTITRDRAGAHTRLVAAFFSETSMYDETRFRKTFRMARPRFNQIVNAISLRFVEEPVEIMDREVKWLKHSCIPVIKVKNKREKDKIETKPDKKGKRGEAGKSQEQSQSIKEEN
nr:hypothetical protein [Tanacetum cinerariifolium]